MFYFTYFIRIPALYPILEDPPELVHVGYNDVTVKLSNQNYKGEEKPATYMFEYKTASDETWDSSNNKSWNDLRETMLIGLNVSTEYEIRGVLFTEQNERSSGDSPPKKFTTNCDELKSSNVMVTPGNTSCDFKTEVKYFWSIFYHLFNLIKCVFI